MVYVKMVNNNKNDNKNRNNNIDNNSCTENRFKSSYKASGSDLIITIIAGDKRSLQTILSQRQVIDCIARFFQNLSTLLGCQGSAY